MKTIVESVLSPVANKKGKDVAVKRFRITDIPDVMDSMSWPQAALCMRRWIKGEPYEMPQDVKQGVTKPTALPKKLVMDDLPFEWLFSGTTRVKPIIDKLKKELAVVQDYNSMVGRLYDTSVHMSPGLKNFMFKLQKLGAVNSDHRIESSAAFDFSSRSAMQLDELSQINFIVVGTGLWSQATDDLDDVYGALGGFSIKIAATKFSVVHDTAGPSKIRIDEVGLYVRDTYDFLNIDGDQLLGYWGFKGVIRPGPIDFLMNPDFIDRGA